MKNKERNYFDRMSAYEQAVNAIDERSGWVNDENVFEGSDDGDIFDYSPNSRQLMTVTLTRKKWVNRVIEYAKKYPDEVEITHKNNDGSIVAHIPVSYLKITRPREVSEEKRQHQKELLEQLRKDGKVL